MLSFYAQLSVGLIPECYINGWVSIRPWQNEQIFPILTIICLMKYARNMLWEKMNGQPEDILT